MIYFVFDNSSGNDVNYTYLYGYDKAQANYLTPNKSITITTVSITE